MTCVGNSRQTVWLKDEGSRRGSSWEIRQKGSLEPDPGSPELQAKQPEPLLVPRGFASVPVPSLANVPIISSLYSWEYKQN